ncbi:MAG: putative toxin-antitoxin system toxin component, PIN family [Betaproteobacteria bacterium]
MFSEGSLANPPFKVVLDTNVLVSALLFKGDESVWLVPAWEAALLVPLVSPDIVTELARILNEIGSRKFGLDAAAIEAIIGDYLQFAQSMPIDPVVHASLPKCRDRDDQKFLDLAHRAKADALITGDAALLGLSRKTPFLILTVIKFREALASRMLLHVES